MDKGLFAHIAKIDVGNIRAMHGKVAAGKSVVIAEKKEEPEDNSPLGLMKKAQAAPKFIKR